LNAAVFAIGFTFIYLTDNRIMAAFTLKHAEALRVIGQHLPSIGTDSFLLANIGDEYIVQFEHEFVLTPVKKTFFGIIADKLWGSDDTSGQMKDVVCFPMTKILWLDLEKRVSSRVDPHAMPDPGNFSLTLRVLGDYLDRKQASRFAITWSTQSILVNYNAEVERLTRQSVYDLGIRMYLRRSSRVMP